MKVITSVKNTEHLIIENSNKAINKNLMLMEKNLAENCLLREAAEKLNIKFIIKFTNLKQFCYLSVRDIIILTQDALTEKTPVRKNLYYRCLVLLIYEFLKAFKGLSKDFHEIIDELNLKTEHRKTYIKIKKTLSQIYDKHYKHFKQIRINVVGHRDIDAKKQIAIIDKLNEKAIEIAKVGYEIHYWFNSFLSFWNELDPVLRNKLKEIAVKIRSA